MALTDTFKALPDQFLDALDVAHQMVLTNASATVASTQALMPPMPALPFADRLPSPVGMADAAFGFADKVMSSQRDFTLKMMAIWTPPAEAPKPVKATPAK